MYDEGYLPQFVSLVTVLSFSNIKNLNLSGTGIGCEGSKLLFWVLKNTRAESIVIP